MAETEVNLSNIWRRANTKLVPCAIMVIVGIFLSTFSGNIRSHGVGRKFIAIVGIIVFIFFATAFLQVLTKTVHRFITLHRLGGGRASSIQFILRALGYGAIIVATLDLLTIPVGRILLGSAVLGIILGVAAQQALANFFASIVLIITHPFTVGEDIKVVAMGITYEGIVLDIGLTHTKLEEKNGTHVLLPNAVLLSNAAIMPQRHKHVT